MTLARALGLLATTGGDGAEPRLQTAPIVMALGG
jgi:hypothetical protein